MQIASNMETKLFGFDKERVWDTESAFERLKLLGEVDSKRTTERRLARLQFLPAELSETHLRDELDRPLNKLVLDWALERARKRRELVLFIQLGVLPSGKPCFYANDARGARYWLPLKNAKIQTIEKGLEAIQKHVGKPISIFPHGMLVERLRAYRGSEKINFCSQAYNPVLPIDMSLRASPHSSIPISPHLKSLEAESIYVIREAVAEAQNPVMMYSIGKDSGVMLHLARKAFYPAPPHFPSFISTHVGNSRKCISFVTSLLAKVEWSF